MTTRALILLLLFPALCMGQTGTLQNLPASFTVRTYPGKPLSIRFSLGTDSLKTTATAVLRYAPGQRAFPSESQPVVATGPTSFSVSWPAYPAVPGTQFVEVSLGGVVQVTGTIIASYLSATTATTQSLTINHGSVVAVNLQVIGGVGGGFSPGNVSTFELIEYSQSQPAMPGTIITHQPAYLVTATVVQKDTRQIDTSWYYEAIDDTSGRLRGPPGEACYCTVKLEETKRPNQ